MANSDFLHLDPNLDQFDISQDMYTSKATSSDLSCDKCLCSTMLEVYEIAELGLARLRRNNSTDVKGFSTTSFNQPFGEPVDELRWQKEVLKSCEMWLSRDAARIQSQHAMLMVCIFDRLLISIMSISGSPKDKRGDRFYNSSVASRRLSDTDGEQWSCQDADYTADESQWKEEDEETLHVMKSLLNFRASRLKGLLERLVAIAASNQWQTQTVMVQDLLERLSKRGDC
ncbi:hypothetical protein ACEQ8H_008082 [Pleosporales sp. CAS-2024a]